MAFVAIAVGMSLAAPASPAGASSPNAASSAKACTRGQSIDNLGFHWSAQAHQVARNGRPPARVKEAAPSRGRSVIALLVTR